MKFGLTIPTLTAVARSTENYEGGSRVRYERTYEICAIAEELGYDFGTIGHHRFSPDVLDASAPLIVLGAIASRTKTLKLCTNIVLMPTYPAIDFAEQVATIDEVSDGRLILGLGIGYRAYEFEALGLNYKDRTARLEEGVEILRRAWRKEPVNFEGKHFNVRNLEILPKPVQPGGPPLWIGAMVPAAIERAARIGDGWITDHMQTVTGLAPKIAKFRSDSHQHGNKGTVAIVRKVGVAPSRQQLNREWFPEVLRTYRLNMGHGVEFADQGLKAKLMSGEPLEIDDFPDDLFIAGTPAECVEQIRSLKARTGAEYIICDFGRAAHGVEYEKLRDMISLFGREVIPHFQ